MKKIGIYKITSPSGKVYIGQSIDIDKRFRYYERLHCKNQLLLFNSFKKYGLNEHKFEIITLCNESQLNDLERYYQNLYCVLGENGLNLKLTETNECKAVFKDCIRKKISDKLKLINRKPHSIETKVKMSLSQKDKPKSAEHRLKMSIERKKRGMTDEHKQKLILSRIGIKRKPHSTETRLKMSIAAKNRKQKLNLSLQYGEQTEKSGQEGI